jgi:hypothetical protein
MQCVRILINSKPLITVNYVRSLAVIQLLIEWRLTCITFRKCIVSVYIFVKRTVIVANG